MSCGVLLCLVGGQLCLVGYHLCFVGAEVRPQRSAADVRRELEAREEARNHVKLIWRALAAMASGEPAAATASLQKAVSSQLHQLFNSTFCAAESGKLHSCYSLSSCVCTIAATSIHTTDIENRDNVVASS